jgi:YD repeat-containing protein
MGSLRRQVRREALTGKQQQTLRFAYDAYENLRIITNEKGEQYRFRRNRNDEVVEETGFDGQTKKYLRSRDGLVLQTLLPGNKKTQYEYDPAGRLLHTRYHDGSQEAYQYDAAGLLIRADNGHSTVQFARDALGRITGERQGMHTIDYSYTEQGQLGGISSSLGAEVQYGYDTLGQLSHITAWAGPQGAGNAWQAALHYTGQGQLQQRHMSGGIASTFAYDHTGMPVSQQVTVQHSRATTLHKSYEWAQGSRLMQVLDRLSGRSTPIQL